MRSSRPKNLRTVILISALLLVFAGVLIVIFIGPPRRLFAGSGLSNAVSSVRPDKDLIPADSIHNSEYIAVWDEDVPKDERKRLIEDLEAFSITEEFDDIYMILRCTSLSPEEAVEMLNKVEGIDAADPNYIMYPESLEDDTYGKALWGLHNTGYYDYFDFTGGTSLTLPIHTDIDINYPEALDLYATLVPEPEPVVVAVIDTGIDINHPDLKDHIWVNPGEIPGDGIDNDNNGYVDDIYGWDFYNNDNTICHYATDVDGVYIDNDIHGTKVAGIIAAAAGNSEGIAGVASFIPVQIMSVKMNGGSRSYGTVANAIKAVNYATSMGADVCNMSWGIQKSGKNETSTTLESLKTAMQRSDMLFVCAAGNTGTNNDEYPVYPASFSLENSISVTWCNQFGKLIAPTETSNEGSCFGIGSVDIAAPGVYVVSTVVGGGYAADSGSSLAAPYVSGIAAVLMSTGRNLYPSEIKNLILSTRKTVPADGIDYTEEGNENPFLEMAGKLRYPGIPDLYAALLAAGTLKQDTDTPELSFKRTFEGDLLILSVTGRDILSGIRTIRYTLDRSESDAKDAAYFLRGIQGSAYTGALRLGSGGIYTFYVSDYAGNEAVIRYTLMDDTTAPKIDLLDYFVSPSGTTLAVLDVSDYESGLSKFMLRAGVFTPAEFADDIGAAAELAPIDGRLLLKLSGTGTYTLFAEDHRGNIEVYSIKLDNMPEKPAPEDPKPTGEPGPSPTGEPGPSPTGEPGPSPTGEPGPSPTGEPEPSPTGEPGPSPTGEPGPSPTGEPGPSPTGEPGPSPTNELGPSPTGEPGPSPTGEPGPSPTGEP
jgi:hypothetical protein